MRLFLRSFASFALMLSCASNAYAQNTRASCERDYSPTSGQAGKDVIWVATPDELVTAMLKAAQTTANDIVYDLGAGDGKIAIAAAKQFGARAVGVEYEQKLATFAKCLVSAEGLGGKVKIIQGDIFATDFSEATVVTLYLLPILNERLRPTILKMKPGTRVVSHSFLMGDWRPDQRIVDEGFDTAYLWIVPTQVAGTWRFQSSAHAPLTLKLTQEFQKLNGVAVVDGQEFPIQEASVRGDTLSLTYVGKSGAKKISATIDKGKANAIVSDEKGSTEYTGTKQ